MHINKIIERLGGVAEVGRVCGVTRQAIFQWERVPTRFVLKLAKLGAVTPHEMRADVYPHPLDGQRKRKRARSNGHQPRA